MQTMDRPPEFTHPFESNNVLWRAFFVVRRALFLIYTFTPLMSAALMDYVFAETDYSTWWRRNFLDSMFRAMSRGGCSTQKFAQWISMRPDMFPVDIVERLADLQDNAPAHSYARTRALIAESFVQEVEEIFEWFE